ncbi:MAG: hypothetical protein GQ534_07205 [Candidatus Delongbacteria bacterium]|nr:hypothetical protein [Candidatus Delongbacteria bacterium]
MAEITRNSKENYLEIYEGFHKSKFRDEMEYIPVQNSEYDLIKDKKKITGVKLNNFFETIELASYHAENEMKKILERRQYKSLYTGSFLQISEQRQGFHLNIGNSRPDFLVKIPSIGKIFIDVKCRKMFEVALKEEESFKFFSLNKDEIIELNDIQKDIDIPVWIAIKDFTNYKKDKNTFPDNKFYIAPVSLIYKFIKRLNSKAGKRNGLFYSYKIPVELFTCTNTISSLDFDKKLDRDQLKLSTNLMLNSLDEIKSVITEVLSKEKTYKTYLPYILSGYYSADSKISKFVGALSYLTPQDINSVLWTMIADKEVIYTKGKPLEISKEGIKK